MYFTDEEWDMDFIKQDDFVNHVKGILNKMYEKKNIGKLSEFNKNLIDPIKLTFDTFTNQLTKKTLIISEIDRQVDKSITNYIGEFHQNIFKYIDGWIVPKAGFDMENKDMNIYVELKNKHNTMNSASSQKTYINLQQKILEDSKATCMLVEIIAKKSQNIEWNIKLDGKNYSHDKIRRVSIDNFYEIATGDERAFSKICSWLPIVIKKITDEMESESFENKFIEEISNLSDSFIKGLYILSFDSYAGFDNLEFKHRDELKENDVFK